MAILVNSNQYKHTGKGPLDAKLLVKTYADLLLTDTWTVENKVAAYNGMITAVWLNKEDTSKNGIYFLHDPAVTSTLKTPDVTNEANWHKLGGLADLQALAEQIDGIKNSVETLQSTVEDLQESATEIVELKSQLPETGVAGKIYVVTEEAATYVWCNSEYLPVGDGAGEDSVDIQLINGGSPEV